jgi:hypothetical protein
MHPDRVAASISATTAEDAAVGGLGRRGASILGTWAAAVGVGGIGLWSLYSAQFQSGFDRFPGPRGDTRLIAYLLEHWYQTLSGRSSLLSPEMFYPVKKTLGYSDVLLGFVPFYAPLRGLGVDIFTALAITIVVINALNYVLCFVLLRRILRLNLLASCAGSFFFAFNDPKVAQPDHIQMQALFFLPITVGSLILVFRDLATISQRRAFALLAVAALALDLELLTAYYVGWFFIFWAGALLLLALVLENTRRFLISFARQFSRPLLGGVAVLIAGLIPFALIYAPVYLATGAQRYADALSYIPEPKSFLLMADRNYVWDHLTTYLLGSGDPQWGRRVGFGLVASVGWLVLSAIAVVLVWRFRRAPHEPASIGGRLRLGQSTILLAVGLAILAVDVVLVLALQYRGYTPWWAVYHLVPGAQGIRAVARSVIVLALPMAILFAVAIHRLSQWILSRRPSLFRSGFVGALILLLAFGVVEQLNGASYLNSYSIPAENARMERLAARLPADCSVFYVTLSPHTPHPQNRLQYQHDALFVSVLRHVPTVNGRSGKYPPGWPLYHIKAADYEHNVRDWIRARHIQGRICALEVPD